MSTTIRIGQICSTIDLIARKKEIQRRETWVTFDIRRMYKMDIGKGRVANISYTDRSAHICFSLFKIPCTACCGVLFSVL